MNIYQRINEVRRAVPYIKKDASVDRYTAISHDMVTAKLRDSLIKHGIMIVPNQVSGTVSEAGTTKHGTPIIRYEANYNISFVNADDPQDRFSVDITAHANDTGDKSPGKTLSYAVKSAMLKVFSLETGENDESRVDSDRKGKLVAEHLAEELQEYIDYGDSLAIHLFSRNVGEDMWADMYNSAPQGKKVAHKKLLDEHGRVGFAIQEAINQAILQVDELAAKENMADVTDGCKRLLDRYLGREKSTELAKLLK